MKTGRGHIDTYAISETKKYLRLCYPGQVRPIEISEYLTEKLGRNISQARAARLLDYFSGDCGDNENTVTDFLVYADYEVKPTTYGIFKDIELGVYL
jgi:hypothetical protein